MFQAILSLALLAPAADAPKRPNVVLILADDLGVADLGCYGSTYHKTPHLDALAATGMRFTTAYAACPVCSPSRYALMTGQVTPRGGITDFLPGRPDRFDQRLARPKLEMRLPEKMETVASLLKGAGYATGIVGKWHLGGKGSMPTDYGFDNNPGPNPKGDALSDVLTGEALSFLDKNHKKPFFLYLAHHAPHIPLRVKPETLKKYPGKLVYGKQSNPHYAGMLDDMDAGLGKVFAKLDELKVRDNTVVIFTSDNGGLSVIEGALTPATVNAPFREGKGYLYEGGLRVPLVVSWPGVVAPKTTSAHPVITHDLFATVLDACGVALPKRPVDGVSLLPLLKGGSGPERRALYWHYPHYPNQGGRPGGAIREGRYKLIEFFEGPRVELFDLQADVSESRNLAAAKPEVVKDLSAKLAAWRKEVGAKMPTPNPMYKGLPPDKKTGEIVLPGNLAVVTGNQLRFEPLPHKWTLGYWSDAGDTASWDVSVPKKQTYEVEVLQGCGTGNGGSVVEIVIGPQKVTFTVEDTGGWQSFKARTVGRVTLEAGDMQKVTVRPVKKAKSAVMDLRRVVLKPVG